MGTDEEMEQMRDEYPELKAHFPTKRAQTIEDARLRQEFCRVKGIYKKHHTRLSCDVCGDLWGSWQKWCAVCKVSYVSGKGRHDKCRVDCGFCYRDGDGNARECVPVPAPTSTTTTSTTTSTTPVPASRGPVRPDQTVVHLRPRGHVPSYAYSDPSDPARLLLTIDSGDEDLMEVASDIENDDGSIPGALPVQDVQEAQEGAHANGFTIHHDE